MDKQNSKKKFPGYKGRWPLQNFICSLFHDADLAKATRSNEKLDILQAYGVAADEERNLVIPSTPGHLQHEDVRDIFTHCTKCLIKDRPWGNGAPRDVKPAWKAERAYDKHWPVQNVFNAYVNRPDVASSLVWGKSDERRALLSHFGVTHHQAELFGAGMISLEPKHIKAIFDEALREFDADRPANIW